MVGRFQPATLIVAATMKDPLMTNGGVSPEFPDWDEHTLTPYELFMWGPYYPERDELRSVRSE